MVRAQPSSAEPLRAPEVGLRVEVSGLRLKALALGKGERAAQGLSPLNLACKCEPRNSTCILFTAFFSLSLPQ